MGCASAGGGVDDVGVCGYLGGRSDHPGRAVAGMPHQGVAGHRLPWVRQSADVVFPDARRRAGGREVQRAGPDGDGVVGVGIPGLDLRPGDGPADRELATPSLGAAVTLSLVSAWFVVRNIPFAPFNWLYV